MTDPVPELCRLEPKSGPLECAIMDCLPPVIVSERSLFYVDAWTGDAFELLRVDDVLTPRKADAGRVAKILKSGWAPLRSYDERFFTLVGLPKDWTGAIVEGELEEFSPSSWSWVRAPRYPDPSLPFDAFSPIMVKQEEGGLRFIRRRRPTVDLFREDVSDLLLGRRR